MALNVKTSLVDLMKSKGMDSSWDARVKFANQNGIANYSGTAAQNTQLMKIINSSASNTQNAAAKNTAKSVSQTVAQTTTQNKKNTNTSNNAVSTQNQQNQTNLQASSDPAQNTLDVKAIYDSVMQSVGAAPTYQSNYKAQLDSLLAQIATRPDFSYDQGSDSLYQQYRDQYTANGNKAMRDTMGNAAALTGGYGSSYATAAGSQAFDAYMEALNDKGLELRDRAYQQYQDEGTELLNRYNAYASAENLAYQKYLQEYAMWGDRLNTQMGIADATINQANNDRNYALDYEKYLESVRQNEIANQWRQKEFDYGVEQDEKQWAYTEQRDAVADEQWRQQFDYNKSRDVVEDSQWKQQFDYNKQMDERELALAASSGISEEKWQAAKNDLLDKAMDMVGMYTDDQIMKYVVGRAYDEAMATIVLSSLGIVEDDKKKAGIGEIPLAGLSLLTAK